MTNQSESINELATALSKAQGELRNPPKTRTVKITTKSGSAFSYKYADLGDVIDILRPVFAKHGLSVVQLISGTNLVTRLMHESGQWIQSEGPLVKEDNGIKALGSAITYMRRYHIQAIAGIAADDDDDAESSIDRAKPKKARPKVSEKQKELVDKLVAQLNGLTAKAADDVDTHEAVSAELQTLISDNRKAMSELPQVEKTKLKGCIHMTCAAIEKSPASFFASEAAE